MSDLTISLRVLQGLLVNDIIDWTDESKCVGEAANEIDRLEKDRISLAGALRTIRDSTAEVDSLSWQTADEALGQLGPGDTDE